MSGGSYDYLYGSDFEDLVSRRREALERMVDRLEGLDEAAFPGVTAAAADSRRLMLQLDSWAVHAEAQVDRLGSIWHAVEWWDSCDSGPDDVRQALQRFIDPEPGDGRVRLPRGVERRIAPLEYSASCWFCQWRGRGSYPLVEDAAMAVASHQEDCPRRCPERVDLGEHRCDLFAGHSDRHAHGDGPFSKAL